MPAKKSHTLRTEDGTIRLKNGRFGPGNPGKPKGAKHLRKVEVLEIKAFAHHVLFGEDPQKYAKNLGQRIFAGDAPHAEKFLLEHLFGKPKETIDLNITQSQLLAVLQLSDLELSEFLRLVENQQHDEALRLLPGGTA
jgi:hypothetical protein